ncbi:unnamed protein product [Penicillium manginii]
MPATSNRAKSKKCQKACARKKQPCRFPAEDNRVSVSERYLRQLEAQLMTSSRTSRHSNALDTHNLATSPFAAGDDDAILSPSQGPSFLLDDRTADQWGELSDGLESTFVANQTRQIENGQPREDVYVEHDGQRSRFSRNPLVDRDPSFAMTPDGRFWYMGPTSSWSFCRRVLALIGRRVPEANCPPDPWHLDGMAFKLHWRPVPSDEVPDVTNLPPLDYALFLFNTVKFYFGFLSFMIDEESYLRNLYEFYENPSSKAASSRYWYAQYLLVLAFGKAFLTARNPSGTPPGHQYASRAMSLLPDLSGMHEDPLTCIQALSLGAVYLQSIDMRRAAFQHVSIPIPKSKYV